MPDAVVAAASAAAQPADLVVASNASASEEIVKLISSDTQTFQIPRSVALCAGTLRNILSSPGMFVENVDNEIHLKEIRGVVLAKVVDYLHYKHAHASSSQHSDAKDDKDHQTQTQTLVESGAAGEAVPAGEAAAGASSSLGSTSTGKKEVKEFVVDPELALELLMAADFLDC